MTEEEVIAAILDGELDDSIKEIIDTCQIRHKAMGAETFDLIEIGDTVRIKAGMLKPKYLDGALGVVVDKRITKVTVQFNDDIYDPYGKWAGKRAICHAEHMERVSE